MLHHYVLGKNLTSVQNVITLAQKKDAELHIIEGYIIMIQITKLTISPISNIRIKIVIQDPSMVVVAPIS